MDTEDGFRLGRVEFVKAALRADDLVQHRAHRAIGDENRISQPFVEIENLHDTSAWKINLRETAKAFSAFAP
jgi:hypothetical protein